MSAIKNMGAAFCTAVFVAGILKMLFPEGELKEVINAVLAVYILASFLKAMQIPPTEDLLQELYLAASQKLAYEDMSDYALQQYQAAIESYSRAEEVQNENTGNHFIAGEGS